MDKDIKYKAFLYGVPLFLTPFADKILPILFGDQWPSPQKTVGCTLLGIIGCSIGLRAYFDGSYERGKIDKANANSNGNGNGNGNAPASNATPGH